MHAASGIVHSLASASYTANVEHTRMPMSVDKADERVCAGVNFVRREAAGRLRSPDLRNRHARTGGKLGTHAVSTGD